MGHGSSRLRTRGINADRESGSQGAVQRVQAGTHAQAEKTGTSRGEYVDYERGSDPGTLSRRYGFDIGNSQARRVQRLESDFGTGRVQRWADEGMTVETMGKPRDMEAFRKRKAKRSGEIPADIERRNQASIQRNSNADQQNGPAGDAGVPGIVSHVVSSPGTSMDGTVQREMESKMGGDFSDVRLHTGPKAAAAAESIDARAFTVGNHVAFNRREYRPESGEGKKLLAHELTHVRQQTDGAVSLLPKADTKQPSAGRAVDGNVHVQPKLTVSSLDDPAEKEAEEVAETVGRTIQRDSETGTQEEPTREEDRSAAMGILEWIGDTTGDERKRSSDEEDRICLPGEQGDESPRMCLDEEAYQERRDKEVSERIEQETGAFTQIEVLVGDETVTFEPAYYINEGSRPEDVADEREAHGFDDVVDATNWHFERLDWDFAEDYDPDDGPPWSGMRGSGGGRLRVGAAVRDGKATPGDLQKFVQVAINEGHVQEYAITHHDIELPRGIEDEENRMSRRIEGLEELATVDSDGVEEVVQDWVDENMVGLDCSAFVVYMLGKIREEEIEIAESQGRDAPDERDIQVRNAQSFTNEDEVERPQDLRPGDVWVLLDEIDHIRLVAAVEMVDDDHMTFETVESAGSAEGIEEADWTTESLEVFGQSGSFYRPE